MFLNVDILLWVFFIKILLKELEGNSVSYFMRSKSRFVFDLQTIVGQVCHNVFWIDAVLLAWCPQIAFIEKVKIKLVRVILNVNQCPNSDVELSLLVQQRPLDVLLHNPARILWLLCQISHNLSYLREKLNTSAAVQGSWLENPLILFTMLLRHIFL